MSNFGNYRQNLSVFDKIRLNSGFSVPILKPVLKISPLSLRPTVEPHNDPLELEKTLSTLTHSSRIRTYGGEEIQISEMSFQEDKRQTYFLYVTPTKKMALLLIKCRRPSRTVCRVNFL
jgi:hypothetical protein